MSDNPRMPGHPSDIPSSRSVGETTHTPVSSGPGSPVHPDQNTNRSPSGNNQTRNLIIGTIATIIASTSVYYLTQFINNRKSSETSITYPEKKEATINAWKRYVAMDNLYYRSVSLLSREKTLLAEPEKFVAALSKEADIFKKDAGKIAKENGVDPALKTMLTRRIGRQTEYIALIDSFMATAKIIAAEKTDRETQNKKILAASIPLKSNVRLLYEKAANEIEELSKTLSSTYAVTFDPKDVMLYADYKNGIDPGNDNEDDNNATPVDPKNFVGNWESNGNKLTFLQKGTMTYDLVKNGKGTGTWKIENNKLRVDAVSAETKFLQTVYFRVSKITASSFTITLTVSPYDEYDYTRVKVN